MKTPILTPENELPELECEKGWQAIEIDFRDDANDLLIETMVTVYVKLEKSGDGHNTPHDITSKTDVHSIEYHCFDFEGKRVIDEEGVIYKELEKIIKGKYEN
jgi:hypothetical protein